MLDILHKKINQIISIEGISENEDGSYRIDYINNPNEDQLNQINNIIENWLIDSARINKISDLDAEWQKILNNGWVTPHGWKLGLTTNDLVLLNGNFMLAKEAAANNIGSPIFVIDTTNEPHELNLQELTTLMLQYGAARANLSSLYSFKLKLINEAQSIEEINNLSVTL